MRIDELEYQHSIVVYAGGRPWLGAVVQTAEPLTGHSIRSFGRFDHLGDPTYLYISSTAAWERDGHVGAAARSTGSRSLDDPSAGLIPARR